MSKELLAMAAAPVCIWGYRMARKACTATFDMEKEVDVMARTAWGEARGEGFWGMLAVCNVIMNRTKKGGWWGDTIGDVCQKPYQFSCWNKNDPNCTKLQVVDESDENFRTARWVARLVVDGYKDTTNGATHYHATSIPEPDWTKGATKTALVEGHVFYKGVT